MDLRRDYFLDRWVIINPKRGLRPHQFTHKPNPGKAKKDYFAPGNEMTTPMELGRVGTDKKWEIMWFMNKFPAVQTDGDYTIQRHNKFYTFSASYGWHEVIVETPSGTNQLYSFTKKQVMKLLRVYQQRIKDVRGKEGVKYASLFKNHGPDAGTSIAHSHSQLIGYNLVPEIIKQKLKKSRKHGKCLYCEVIEAEKDSDRRCFENEMFIAFTPYASRFNYEIWLMPKKHISDFSKLNPWQLDQFCDIFMLILKKLKKIGCSFNFYFQNYGKMHFHVEFCPRIATWAGFEFSTDTIINSMSPEEAAKFYRDK